MPTLTLADGSALTWDAPAAPVVAPDPAPVPEPSAVSAPDPAPAPTEADVATALATAPPRWTATLTRFAKTFAACAAVSFAVYGGDIGKALHDPVGLMVATGTAIVMSAEKFLRWKD